MNAGSCKKILCAWLPNWPIQRVQALEPSLSQQPLALTARDPRRGLIVAAANRWARAAGVRPHMRLAEATGLAELTLREHEPAEDLETLCSLAEQAQQFSPWVGIESLDRRLWAGRWLHQPESLLLDMTGLGNLFGGDANLLSQMGGWLEQQSYFGCLAVGSSVGAAWALANYALRTDPSLASPGSGPDNRSSDQPSTQGKAVHCDLSAVPSSRYLLLPPDLQQQQIARLPLTALRIDEATVGTLHRLGVFRIAQLADLPRAGLASRLGDQLLRRWDQVMGVRDEPITALHASPEWSCQQELEIPTDSTETIAELMRRAVQNLASQMEKRGEGAVRIICRLDLVEQPSLVLQLGLFRPTCDQAHLNMLLNCLLEQHLPQRMAAPLWRLTVSATLTAPLVWQQGELFQADQAANRHQMSSLVDMLSARLGRKAVLKARVQRESQPELAFALQPLTGLRPDARPQSVIRKLSSRQSLRTVEPRREDPLRRPTQLFQPPLPITVAGAWCPEPAESPLALQPVAHQSSGVPPDNQSDSLLGSSASSQPDKQGLAAAPARIKTANGWHQVMDARGPERLESGWWRGPSCRRDYYRIATHQGSWWWIFRDLKTGLWYLHGLFD